MARKYYLPREFTSILDRTEGAGAYSTLFGHAQRKGPFAGTDVSKMSIRDVLDFTDPKGDYAQYVKGQVGHVATPTGRYQIVGSTLRNATNALGLSPDQPYDAETQDRIARHLVDQRLAGAGSQEAKRAALRSEWEGFKHVSNEELDRAIAALGQPSDTYAAGYEGETIQPETSDPIEPTQTAETVEPEDDKKKGIFGITLPDKIAGVDTEKGLEKLGDLSKLLNAGAENMNKQVPKGGRASTQNVEMLQANTGGLLGGLNNPGQAQQAQLTPWEMELMRLRQGMGRSGGLGGLGGIGRYLS